MTGVVIGRLILDVYSERGNLILRSSVNYLRFPMSENRCMWHAPLSLRHT